MNLKKATNLFLKNITKNLEEFSYNKIIANLHEIYSFLIKQIEKPYKKKHLLKIIKKF